MPQYLRTLRSGTEFFLAHVDLRATTAPTLTPGVPATGSVRIYLPFITR